MTQLSDDHPNAFSFSKEPPAFFRRRHGTLRQADRIHRRRLRGCRPPFGDYAAELGKVNAVSDFIELNTREARRSWKRPTAMAAPLPNWP